jgi:serine/threonine protein phosphatase PrpC
MTVTATQELPTWNAWGDSDPGRSRANNEDRCFCDPARGIFLIVDGMGGEAAGEVAAQVAIDAIRKRLSQETGTVARRLREAIAGANNEICRMAENHPEYRGMACVLTMAMAEDGALHIGHVGDSRLYLIQDGRIAKITPDHSPIGAREDAGELSELEAMRHPRRNEVFRDVGSRIHNPDDPDFIDYLKISFAPEAAVLLCSDGLSDLLTSSEIASEVIRNAGRPSETVRRLISMANAVGGKDNISVIVVEGADFPRTARDQEREAELALRTIAVRKSSAGIGSGFLGRWAFLGYGILGGLLLAGLYGRLSKSAPEEALQIILPAPRTLLVEPLSPEFPSIARALEAARPGDRIEIADGEYPESIYLKSGVDLAARSPGKAVLHFMHAIPGANAAIIAESVSDVKVSGLVVKADLAAALPYGAWIHDSTVELSNLDISGAVQAGVFFNGNSQTTLTGSFLHACLGPGIVVSDSAGPLLLGNVIYGNGISREKAAPGMVVSDNANPKALRNVFSGNGAGDIRVPGPELQKRMLDNLFAGPGKPDKAVVIERAGK